MRQPSYDFAHEVIWFWVYYEMLQEEWSSPTWNTNHPLVSCSWVHIFAEWDTRIESGSILLLFWGFLVSQRLIYGMGYWWGEIGTATLKARREHKVKSQDSESVKLQSWCIIPGSLLVLLGTGCSELGLGQTHSKVLACLPDVVMAFPDYQPQRLSFKNTICCSCIVCLYPGQQLHSIG